VALTFQGYDWSALNWGVVTQVRARASGGSYAVAGELEECKFRCEPKTEQGDPAGSQYPQYLKYFLSGTFVQTDDAAEVAMIDDDSSTGLFGVDVNVELTFASGKVIVLGEASGYPLRLNPGFVTGDEDKADRMPFTASNIEPLDSFPGKRS